VRLQYKRLELLRELIPTATIMASLVHPTNPNAETISRNLQSAARTLGLQIHVLYASTERDIDDAFTTLIRLRAGALVIGSDPFFNSRSEQLATLAVRHAIPTIYQYREFAAAGGLMSYGGSNTDAYRRAGVYTGRILQGDKPADLPVSAVNQGRADHQSQDRQDARPRSASDTARPRRRGDRIARPMSPIGTTHRFASAHHLGSDRR
jgi:putative tryptophan/tyrosine transport system substrate-binding protein